MATSSPHSTSTMSNKILRIVGGAPCSIYCDAPKVFGRTIIEAPERMAHGHITATIRHTTGTVTVENFQASDLPMTLYAPSSHRIAAIVEDAKVVLRNVATGAGDADCQLHGWRRRLENADVHGPSGEHPQWHSLLHVRGQHRHPRRRRGYDHDQNRHQGSARFGSWPARDFGRHRDDWHAVRRWRHHRQEWCERRERHEGRRCERNRHDCRWDLARHARSVGDQRSDGPGRRRRRRHRRCGRISGRMWRLWWAGQIRRRSRRLEHRPLVDRLRFFASRTARSRRATRHRDAPVARDSSASPAGSAPRSKPNARQETVERGAMAGRAAGARVGISVDIAYTGTFIVGPNYDCVRSFGSGRDWGNPGVNDGVPGVAMESYAIPAAPPTCVGTTDCGALNEPDVCGVVLGCVAEFACRSICPTLATQTACAGVQGCAWTPRVSGCRYRNCGDFCVNCNLNEADCKASPKCIFGFCKGTPPCDKVPVSVCSTMPGCQVK